SPSSLIRAPDERHSYTIDSAPRSFRATIFFHCNRHLRAPPSFPTRRSSDLGRGGRDDLDRGRTPRTARPRPTRPGADEPHRLLRSEEHTSELQSRRDLVCRLLLEKKKNAQHVRKCGVIYNIVNQHRTRVGPH